MGTDKKLVVSHAPFWHNGSRISTRNIDIMIAAALPVIAGIARFGPTALGVVALSIGMAMLWELLLNKAMKRPVSIGDLDAAAIGLVLGMLLPASAPWWLIVVGAFVAVVVGKMIYGGIGGNPFSPVAVAMAVLMLSWKLLLDFDTALLNYNLGFKALYPLGAVKAFGASYAADWSARDLLIGRQTGGVGSVFGLGLILGGVYLVLRGHVRWQIPVSFLAGVAVTAALFTLGNAEGELPAYAGPVFHLLTGYTLIGAFFLLPETSSRPVNSLPLILSGLLAGVLTVLIRNTGAWVDGVIFAVLLVNVAHPLLDMIRPRPLGKVVENA
ncbi:MAG: RnfABCDGE type electron transport complex subunit D [Deltaproteobacteria bacterium]|nr:RnfABCDGE type electron transport complex subunit D [Deltaproteobacteria bacterium]